MCYASLENLSNNPLVADYKILYFASWLLSAFVCCFHKVMTIIVFDNLCGLFMYIYTLATLNP